MEPSSQAAISGLGRTYLGLPLGRGPWCFPKHCSLNPLSSMYSGSRCTESGSIRGTTTRKALTVNPQVTMCGGGGGGRADQTGRKILFRDQTWIYLQKSNLQCIDRACENRCAAVFASLENWKQSKCPWWGDGVNMRKTWYICATEYSRASAKKQNISIDSEISRKYCELSQHIENTYTILL